MTETLTQLIQNILGMGLALSALVVLAVEAVKAMNILPTRWLPLVSVLIGIAVSQLVGIYLIDGTNLVEFGFAGFVSGIVASGLYDAIGKGKDKLTKV